MKSMPMLYHRPLAIGSGRSRPMGLPLRSLVRWHQSQPATYCWVSSHISFQKYGSFMRKNIRSAPNCTPAGVLWASCSIRRCIALGIHNRPLFSAFASSSCSFVLIVISTPSSSSLSLRLPFPPKLHVATVGHFPPNRTVVLTPINCVFGRCSGWRGAGTWVGQSPGNRPEPFVINYARLDVLNPFSGRSNFKCYPVASLLTEIRAARQGVCDLILDTRDVLDLPITFLDDCQDIHLSYSEVRLFEDPTHCRMVHMYQKLLFSSV